MLESNVCSEGAVEVGNLRSALDELRGEDVSTLADSHLTEDFADLQRAGDVLEAERLRRLKELDRRRPFRRRRGFVLGGSRPRFGS